MRGDRCADATRDPDGRPVPAWAEQGPFCGRDLFAVTRALEGMPERYVLLHSQLGAKGQARGARVSGGAKTPPVPVRLDVDALIRDMLLVLCSWHERVAARFALVFPSAELSRARRDEVAIPAAVTTLTPRVGALVALPGEPMLRYLSLAAAAGLPEGTPVRVHKLAGYAEVAVDLDGASAGLELLGLEHRCRITLGQTAPPPETLDGIPCRRCETLGLQVASEPQYKSVCADCGDLLTPVEYRDWTRQYEAWCRAQLAAGLDPAVVAGCRAAPAA